MNVVEKQYIGVRLKAAFAPFVFLAFALLTSGCAVTGSDLTADLVSNDQIVTGSVATPAKVEGVELSDAEIIKQNVVTASIPANATPLAWTNPETGSSGTIVAIDKFMGKHGQNCRGFKTSVDTFMGISFYNGEACEISPQQWVLSWFKPAS